MATKRNDDKGYERGALGISGRRGEDFHPERFPSSGGKLAPGNVDGDKGGPKTRSWGELQSHAKGKGGK